MNLLKNTLLSAVVVGAWGSAIAAPLVDQNSPTGNNLMAAFGQTGLAQSFKQSAANIVGAGIFLLSGRGSSDTVTISLYDKLPNAGGTLLTSGSGTATQGSWFDVFWPEVAISPETTYFLVFTGTSMSLAIQGDEGNPYSRGQVYANTGFQSYTSFDYTFRTYAAPSATVPEPASLGLVGAALFGLAAAARRRNCQA